MKRKIETEIKDVESKMRFFENLLLRGYGIKLEFKIGSLEMIVRFLVDVFQNPTVAAIVGGAITGLLTSILKRKSKDKNKEAAYSEAVNRLNTRVGAWFKKEVSERPLNDSYEFVLEDTRGNLHPIIVFKNCDIAYAGSAEGIPVYG